MNAKPRKKAKLTAFMNLWADGKWSFFGGSRFDRGTGGTIVEAMFQKFLY